MNGFSYEVTLDINESQSPLVLPIRVGDRNRKIAFSLTKGAKPYELEEGTMAYLTAKNNGETYAGLCGIIKGKIICDFSEIVKPDGTTAPIKYSSLTAAEGIADCELVVYHSKDKTETIVAASRFTVVIDPRLSDEDEINYIGIPYEVFAQQVSEYMAADNERQKAEELRVNAETLRNEAETQRDTNESGRIENEESRETAEALRATAENLRIEAETSRAEAEDSRVKAETDRASAEEIRKANEEARVSAEEQRETTFDGYKTYIDEAIEGKEDKSNKVIQLVPTATDDQYPSAKAVLNYVDPNFKTLINSLTSLSRSAERVENRVTAIDENSTDEQYPSTLAVLNLVKSFGHIKTITETTSVCDLDDGVYVIECVPTSDDTDYFLSVPATAEGEEIPALANGMALVSRSSMADGVEPTIHWLFMGLGDDGWQSIRIGSVQWDDIDSKWYSYDAGEFEFSSNKVNEITEENKLDEWSYPSVKAVADAIADIVIGSDNIENGAVTLDKVSQYFFRDGVNCTVGNDITLYLTQKVPDNKVYLSAELTSKTDEITEDSTNEIPTAKAVFDYVNEFGGDSDYTLPIGGEELGGVKNGGNVVINEDGTMTAPASGSGGSGGMSTTAINLLIDILKVGMFTTNVSGKIEALKEALLVGSSGGGDEPDEPDEPITTDDITVVDGIMTIVSVGSEIIVSNGIMTIA